MFQEEYENISNAAVTKVGLLKKNPVGYFGLSMLAGMYIGFGTLLIFSIGGMLNGAAYTKIVMGLAFGIALSLVVIAGGELFTGNNLVMSAGIFKKKITLGDAVKLWVVCYVGNWIGSILLSVLFHYSGLSTEPIAAFIATGAAGKMAASASALLIRGILCNILVCLAVWCGTKCKSESGKLIMIFWCLFAFITTGFEHSVANMTLLTVAVLNPAGQAVSMGGYLFNLLWVTIGNMIGGILFVSVPYYLVSKSKEA